MSFFHYRINWDALFARILYRWLWQSVLCLVLVASLFSLTAGVIPPVWRGESIITIDAPDATILVDGQAWPRQIYAGTHTITAKWPDGRVAWTTVDSQATGEQTVTLRPGLFTPKVRAIPPAAPGLKIDQVWRADAAWRVVSVPNIPALSQAQSQPQSIVRPTPLPGQTVAIGSRGLERMPTIDAYKGVADEIHIDGQLVTTWFARENATNSNRGNLVVQGWSNLVTTIVVSQSVSMIRLAPVGKAMLVSLEVGGTNDGEQINLAVANNPLLTPLIAVPGKVASIEWKPDGKAAIITSKNLDRITLTLVRIEPTIAAAVITEFDALTTAYPVISTAWAENELYWLTSNPTTSTDGMSTLWKAPLDSLIPESQQSMQAYAFTPLPDGRLRVLTTQRNQLVVGILDGDKFIGEGFVPDIPTTTPLLGIWRDNDVLVYGLNTVWLVQFVSNTQSGE